MALDQELTPLAPDWTRYRQLERAGVFKALAARRAGRLLGYNTFFVQPPIHYMTERWALNDVLYLTPEARKSTTGLRLIREAETKLKALGCSKVIYHTKLHVLLGHGGKPLGELFRAISYIQEEEVWAKRL